MVTKAEADAPVTLAGALVGRDSEMALLTGLAKEVAGGRGGSVLMEGEPGIGKSALVRAAVAEAPEAGCQVFWGAGDELGQALPLLPFLDGLRVREPSANPGGRRSSGCCAVRPPPTAARTYRRFWRSSCWRWSRNSARCGRPSWWSMTCSGPTRPASRCGDGWRDRPGRCPCYWSG